MTRVFKLNGLKLASLGLISLMAIMGCTRKFSRLDSDGLGSSGGSSGGNAPITPVGQNASVTFTGVGASGSTYSESAVVYVVGGNSFYTANPGIPGSTSGFDGNPANMTSFGPISFTVSPNTINMANVSVVPLNATQNSFCNNVGFTIQNGTITLNNSASNKLTTMTTCEFMLTSSSDTIGTNQITITFNYTVKDWASPSPLGNGTAAQTTANAIVNSGYIPTSTSLNLSGKNVPDLSPVVALTNLQNLNLSNTGTTTIPSSITQLTALQNLNLSNNQIATIPLSISQLTNLQSLDLSKNNISSIPSSVTQLTSLKFLYLQYNNISVLPSSISQLTNLQTLWINNNQITTIPSTITQLTNLSSILLNANLISTISPDVFNWLKSISSQLNGNPGYPNFGN